VIGIRAGRQSRRSRIDSCSMQAVVDWARPIESGHEVRFAIAVSVVVLLVSGQ